ncbi:MAG: hypothetical protein DKM50_02505 [Candidatus Margulisiibacteriota bacterium]|nr:MAG: hypothetical protein A2X43_03720 [Candidatus Margulisbacteria bacterium GWD2_39_127]PZM83166.1 MAG: hypothetical protein DKM50_02505 [Candidatus Margulisiibacteriota bacterium]HAR62532.1 hypothetical protein [Candidatus Margulisiibacteriota bacterium]HCY38103.1 hypothetical protein [Candidatus Margulisiibacteriota bacterium]
MAEKISPKTVLLIEDHTNIKEIYGKYISSKLGLDVTTEEDGQKAYDIAVKLKPDLIITDLNLPSITGYDLIHMFRNHPDMMCTPIIVISALSHRAQVQECIKLGANDFMVKPASFKLMEEKIRKLLNL